MGEFHSVCMLNNMPHLSLASHLESLPASQSLLPVYQCTLLHHWPRDPANWITSVWNTQLTHKMCLFSSNKKKDFPGLLLLPLPQCGKTNELSYQAEKASLYCTKLETFLSPIWGNLQLPGWKISHSVEFREHLSPVIVILSFLQLVNMPFLQQQLLFFHN